MLWLMFDVWLRFDTPDSFAFSYDKEGDILFFIAKSQIGRVTFKKGGDKDPGILDFDERVEAVQMSDWLANKLADEHELEVEE